MPRQRLLTPEMELRIGRELILAREEGTPWKFLAAHYGLGRTKLWQLWRGARGKDVREHLDAGQRPPSAARSRARGTCDLPDESTFLDNLTPRLNPTFRQKL